MRVPIVVAVVLVAMQLSSAQEPLTFARSIELPRVEGRIDHLAFDATGQRLFVAALGNNTVEVLDVKAGAHVKSVAGFREPQGIAVVPDAKLVAIANGQGEGLQFLNADDYRAGPSVRLGDDSDNVPNADQIAVVDRGAMRVVTTWPVAAAKANFPMALDEANHRLFIGCRRPAKALVYDTASGREVGSFDIVGDTDDLFYDAARKRLYVSGGEGFIDVFQNQDANRFARLAHIATAAGARTSLFVPEQNRLYLAVPHRRGQKAEIRFYDAR